MKDNGFLIVGRTRNANDVNNFDFQIIRTKSDGDTIWTKRFGNKTNEWLQRIVSYKDDEFIVQGTIGFANENQQTFIAKFDINGEIKDSLRFQEISNIVYSPLNYYVKIQNGGVGKVSITSIQPSELFMNEK